MPAINLMAHVAARSAVSMIGHSVLRSIEDLAKDGCPPEPIIALTTFASDLPLVLGGMSEHADHCDLDQLRVAIQPLYAYEALYDTAAFMESLIVIAQSASPPSSD